MSLRNGSSLYLERFVRIWIANKNGSIKFKFSLWEFIEQSEIKFKNEQTFKDNKSIQQNKN